MKDLVQKKLIKQIKKYAKKNVNRARYLHSKSVAKMCVLLAKQFGLDIKKAYLMGISHDICKELSKEEMISLASLDKNKIFEYEINHPGILHGRAASVLLKTKFFVQDKQVLQAVACHVYGKINMDDYSKILYIADKRETRRQFVTKKMIKQMFKLPLEKMFVTVLEESFSYVLNKNSQIFDESQKVVDFYLNKKNL